MEGSICCIGFIPTKRRPKVNRFGGNFEQKNKKEEALIKKAYIEQGGEKYTGAVGLSLTIVKPLPKNTPKKITREPQLVTPDIDNVCKSVMDALNGVAYEDDKQVVRLQAFKLDRRREYIDEHVTFNVYPIGDKETL